MIDLFDFKLVFAIFVGLLQRKDFMLSALLPLY